MDMLFKLTEGRGLGYQVDMLFKLTEGRGLGYQVDIEGEMRAMSAEDDL